MPCLDGNTIESLKPVVSLIQAYSDVDDAAYASVREAGMELLWVYQNDELVPDSVCRAFENVVLDLWEKGASERTCPCDYHQHRASRLRFLAANDKRAVRCLELAGTARDLLFGIPRGQASDVDVQLSHIMLVETFVRYFVACPESERASKVELMCSRLTPRNEDEVRLPAGKRRRRNVFTGPEPELPLKGEFKRIEGCVAPLTYAVMTRQIDEDHRLRSRADIETMLGLLGMRFSGMGEQSYVEIQYQLVADALFLPSAIEARGNWLWMPVRQEHLEHGLTRDLRGILEYDGSSADGWRYYRLLGDSHQPGCGELIHRPFAVSAASIDDILVWRQTPSLGWIDYASRG